MKWLIAAIIIFSSTPIFAQYNAELADSLQSMVNEDQNARNYVDTVLEKFGRESSQWDSAWNVIKATDKKHNPILQKIIMELNSYPGYDIVGEEGAHNFWLLVQHQDRDTTFQKEVLALMRIAIEKNQAWSNNYAYLVDRVKVNTHQKQIYGTQCILDKTKNEYIPRPIEDAANVDKRRSEMDMEPLDEYLKMMNEHHKIKF